MQTTFPVMRMQPHLMNNTSSLGNTSVLFAGKKAKSYGPYKIGVPEKKLDEWKANNTRTFVFDVPGSSILRLSEGDRKALVHLVRAAQALDQVFLKQDHKENIPVKKALQEAAEAGDSHAQKAFFFFQSFNSINGFHRLTNKVIRLIKGQKPEKGLGLYPSDITKKELINYILKHPEQAAPILSNDTIVVRNGNRLEAIPYAVTFREEYEQAARELQQAARVTTNADFAKYLKLQAAALVSTDPVYAYQADEAWAKLEDTPLEFTIGRESYEDNLTASVASDPRVAKLLAELNISPKSKDMIGVRVGIVNREGQELFAKYRRHLHEVAPQIPRSNEYKQDFDNVSSADQVKQSMVDVDLLYIAGDYASKKTGVTLAQNLPNDDKIYTTLGGGRRNVFHRQIRMAPPSDPTLLPKMLNALLVPEQHHLYDDDLADHLTTIGHELGHSLGPKTTASGSDKKGALGAYGDIVEENKADIMSMFMVDHLLKKGELTEKEAHSIYTTWAFDNFPIKKPTLQQPYPVRSVMQAQYFFNQGAVVLDDQKRLKVIPEKMHEAARAMLADIVDVQLEGSEAKAKTYVEKYFVWDDRMEHFAKTILEIRKNPKIFTDVKMPAAEALLANA